MVSTFIDSVHNMPGQQDRPPSADATGEQRSVPSLLSAAESVQTTEVRWWHHGPPPSELAGAIDHAGASRESEAERRVDTYFRHPGTGLSLKLRGTTSLDIKQRSGAAEVAGLAPGVFAWVERWVKWSLPLVGSAAAGPSLGRRPPHRPAHSRP